MGYNGTCDPKHNFYTIFKIFLEVRIVQVIILFDKHIENYLNDRKYQIYHKILETPTIQLIDILVHENMYWGYI
jgi:hypothetical protein